MDEVLAALVGWTDRRSDLWLVPRLLELTFGDGPVSLADGTEEEAS
jgi:hypothetical protein